MAEYSFVSPSYNDIHNACVDIVRDVKRTGKPVELVLGIARGGLMPAVILSHMLEVPMKSVSYSSKSGKGDNKNHDNVLPTLSDVKGTILVVDDICDSGQTLREIVDHFQAQGLSVLTATLFYKVHENQTFIPLDFFWRKILPDAGWITFPFERTGKL